MTSKKKNKNKRKTLMGLKDGKVNKPLSRKEERKQQRKLKKAQKNAFHRHEHVPKTALELRQIEKKKRKERNKAEAMRQLEKSKNNPKKKKKQKKEKVLDDEQEEATNTQLEMRRNYLITENEREDKMIKQLEKQLGLNKRKGKNKKAIPNEFMTDGLGYVLESVDPEHIKALYEQSAEFEDLPSENESESIMENMDDDEDDSFSDSYDKSDNSDEDIEVNKEKSIRWKDLEEKKEEKRQKLIEEINEELIRREKDEKKKRRLSGEDVSDDDENDSDNGDIEGHDEEIDFGSDDDDEIEKMLQGDSDESDDDEMPEGDDMNDDSEVGSDDGSELSESDSHEMDDPDDGGPKLKEDIYGRLRDESGNVVSKTGSYVPPGKRLQMLEKSDATSAEKEKLKKLLKGQINRLSESNMQSIANQVENYYMSHSRALMNSTLAELILGACVSPVMTPERLVTEMALFVAVMHGNVGNEVGAHFLQTIANKFDTLWKTSENHGDGKEIDNLLMLLLHLYNFKVVHSLVITDIIKKTIDDFGEKDIELLVLILKTVGFGLRKDDPAALKEIIQKIQTKAAETDASKFSDRSRVQYMLDILLAIRNNNIRKIPNYDPTHMEHLRKLLRSYIRESGGGDSQLRISLEDLLNSETAGRWWMVGSAWAGREGGSEDDPINKKLDTSSVSAELLQLAKKLRMNTDIRRTIFCIVMTAEDYIDAFEKLLRLGLKHTQEREIIHVIVETCLQEKTYNPFYTLIAQKFAEFDRRFQMTIQFNMWDRLKLMSSMSESQLTNYSKFITYLLTTKALSLSIFKVLDFGELDKSKVRFLRLVLKSILLDHEDYVTKEVFSRITNLSKLKTLRDGLKVFMQHFIIRDKGRTINVDEKLQERVSLAEISLTAVESFL